MPSANPPGETNGAGQGLANAMLAHRPWLRTVVLARLDGDQAATDDVLASMYTELLEKPTPQKQIRDIAPWLYRMAVNRATDWQRQQRRIRIKHGNAALDPGLASEIDAQSAPPIEQLLHHERQQTIRAALHSLESEDIEILTLKYCHNWSYRQLDEHLGIGPHQIAHRLRRARQRLKAVLLRTQFADEFRSLEGFSR